MYRILIVDDEPIVVEGIYQLLKENKEFNLDLCKAYSGIEALEILKSTKVDIVLTDIRMPGLNGLQLLEKIMEYWPACRVIFLTGYDEFDYIYTAMSKPGVRYLLKTEGDEVILKEIKATLEELQEEEERKDFINKAKKQISEAVPLLKKDFIHGLLEGKQSILEIQQEYIKEFNMDLDYEKPVLLMLGQVDFWEGNQSYFERAEIFCTVQDVFHSTLYHFLFYEEIVYENTLLVWLIQPDFSKPRFHAKDGEFDWKSFVSFMKANVESIQNTVKDVAGASVSFAVGVQPVFLEEVSTEFITLRKLMSKVTVLGHEMMIVDEHIADELLQIPWQDNTTDYIRFSKQLEMLELYMERGSEKEFEELFQELFCTEEQMHRNSFLFNIRNYSVLLSLFLSYINRQDLGEEIGKYMDMNQMTTVWESGKWQDTVDYFLQLGTTICKIKKEQKTSEVDFVIERIHTFIHQNLDKDLSLAKIAEVVYFNPSYLSRFYKQETGRNISDYINEIKFEKAKELLADPGLKIHEVAMKVGFASSSYFTLFFKRMLQMTPQEYRDCIIDRFADA